MAVKRLATTRSPTHSATEQEAPAASMASKLRARGVLMVYPGGQGLCYQES
jgi:hypothetical protein